jgi:hypothetical protein
MGCGGSSTLCFRVNVGVGNSTPWGRSGEYGLMLACSTWLLTMQSVRSLGLFFGRMWNLELPSVEGPRETSERIQLVAIRSMVVPAGSNVRVWKRWPGSIGCVGSLPFCLITGLGGATVGTLQPCAAAVAASSWALTGFRTRLLNCGFRSRFFACTRGPWTAPCESGRKLVVGDRLHCALG